MDEPPSWLESQIGDAAAVIWDLRKMLNPEDAETTPLPASPAGGEIWAARGSSDYRLFDLGHTRERRRPHDPARRE